jgi:RNA polymerase sigma-70 factor, ECF subfamily
VDASTERALLELAQGGDQCAFTSLVEPCWFGLFGICSRFIKDRDLAEHTAHSAVQNAFWKIGTCRIRFRPWLYEIGRNLARDLVGSAEYQRTVPLPEQDQEISVLGVEESFEDHLIVQLDIEALIDKLPPAYQQILELRYYADLEFNDIAEDLSISPAAARKLHERAVRALRRLIERGDSSSTTDREPE